MKLVPKRGRRPATTAEVSASARKASRVEQIAELRRELAWDHAAAAKLRREWGIARKRMEELAAEAGRIVAREVVDPEGVTVDVGSRMRRIVRGPSMDKDAAAAGKVWAQLAGVLAPQKHLHAEVAPVLLSDEWRRVYTAIVAALRPYPEAGAAVVAVLEELQRPAKGAP